MTNNADEPIPAGTRPLMVYRHEVDHITVLLPGQMPIKMIPGDELTLRYKVEIGPSGQPIMRYEAIDG
jgi:hypothetical protein